MSDCIFCKILAGEIPSDKVYEDEKMLVFRDIAPQAPIHMLAIPKEHIPSAGCITKENSAIVAHIFEKISEICAGEEFRGGFRIVSNCGKNAGQTVEHLHFHILAGAELSLQMA